MKKNKFPYQSGVSALLFLIALAAIPLFVWAVTSQNFSLIKRAASGETPRPTSSSRPTPRPSYKPTPKPTPAPPCKKIDSLPIKKCSNLITQVRLSGNSNTSAKWETYLLLQKGKKDKAFPSVEVRVVDNQENVVYSGMRFRLSNSLGRLTYYKSGVNIPITYPGRNYLTAFFPCDCYTSDATIDLLVIR